MPIKLPENGDLENTKELENHDRIIILTRDMKWIKSKLDEISQQIDDKFEHLDEKIDNKFSTLRNELLDEIKEVDKKHEEKYKELDDKISKKIEPDIEKLKESFWVQHGYKLGLMAAGGVIGILLDLILKYLF